MQITSKTIQFAIHEIFKSRGVARGGSLSLDALAKAWLGTRLREADLETGLAALEQSGHVTRQRTHFGVDVFLVDDGFARVSTDDDRKAVTSAAMARKLRAPAPSYAAPKERLGTSRRRASDDKKPRG